MPEIKNTFSQGKMNKDLDERLIPNGQYRDAMNIQVSTSEGSDIGVAQNILGNKIISTLFNDLADFEVIIDDDVVLNSSTGSEPTSPTAPPLD
jgi:hypothetical protein|tara:strand:- start:1942 stop:2220 length:279 start_codon:yes stop_codon:yes gene_type:complete